MNLEAAERREQILAALVEAGSVGVSGESLASALGCSRAAVHRHVDGLRRDGVDIVSAHDGYRVAEGADPVASALVGPRLVAPLGGPITWLASVGSTNDELIAQARRGAPEGTIIGADRQHAGRGRRGRKWLAAPGDALLVSVLLRPDIAPVDVGLLPIVAAVGVADSLGPDARIVWPNDILIDGRKVAGILCEMSAEQDRVSWAVVGVGINVHSAPDLDDARWRPGALSARGVAPARGELLVDLLAHLGGRYREWLETGSRGILAGFAERDALVGRDITVSLPVGEISGRCGGTDDLGRLRVLTATGERILGAGEVVRVFPENSAPRCLIPNC